MLLRSKPSRKVSSPGAYRWCALDVIDGAVGIVFHDVEMLTAEALKRLDDRGAAAVPRTCNGSAGDDVTRTVGPVRRAHLSTNRRSACFALPCALVRCCPARMCSIYCCRTCVWSWAPVMGTNCRPVSVSAAPCVDLAGLYLRMGAPSFYVFGSIAAEEA